jgi:hypothetical protein
MNITNMHIAIQQGVDKINSLQADMLLPEEIDLEINKSQMKFINLKYGKNNVYRKGFEMNQKRIDDLRTLVTDHLGNCTYKGQILGGTTNVFHADTVQLPSDYMYLVSQQSHVWIDNCADMTSYLIYPDPLYYFRVSLQDFICDEGNYIVDDIKLYQDAGDPTNTNIETLWTNPGYFIGTAGHIELARASFLGVATAAQTTWWETYSPSALAHPGEFIVVVNPTNLPWTFNADPDAGVVTTLVGRNGSTHVSAARPLVLGTNYDEKRYPTTYSQQLIVNNTFIQHDDIFALLPDPFNTTAYTDPLTTMRDKYLDIYTDTTFIIDKVNITYIREPAEISLPLLQSCELPEHTHQEIVDMAISSILEGISDPRYKTQQLELSKNE